MIEIRTTDYLLECETQKEFVNQVKVYKLNGDASKAEFTEVLADFTVFGNKIEFIHVPKDFSTISYRVYSVNGNTSLAYEFYTKTKRIIELGHTEVYCGACEVESELPAIFTIMNCPSCDDELLPCSICESLQCDDCPLRYSRVDNVCL